MTPELVCIAMLLHLPVPQSVPAVHEVPMTAIHSTCGNRAMGCYQQGNVYIPAGRIRNDARVHELAHFIQDKSGVDMSDWRIEIGANFVARKFNAFCSVN